MNHNSSFYKSLTVLAGILGKKCGVTVRLGNGAYTDGKEITVPVIRDEESLPKDEILGFLVHEAAHVRHTDFKSTTKDAFLHGLTNAIEDARIEHLMVREYPGAKTILTRAHSPVVRDLHDQLPKMPPHVVFSLYVCLQAGALLAFNELYGSLATAFKRRLEEMLGTTVSDGVESLLAQEVQKLQSTADCLNLAKKLKALLRAAQKKAQKSSSNKSNSSSSEEKDGEMGDEQMQQSSASDSGSDSESESSKGKGANSPEEVSDDGQSEPQQASSSEGSESSDSDSETGDQSSESSDGTDSNEQSEDSSSGEDAKEEASNLSKVLKASKKELAEATASLDLSKSAEKANAPLGQYNRVYGYSTSPLDLHRCINTQERQLQGKELLQEARSGSSKARRSLTGIISGKARVGTYTAAAGRTLESSKLCRLAMGNTRVFQRREEAKGVDTCVSIMLDGSMSMDRSSLDLSVQAGLSIQQALYGMPGVKVGVSIFQGYGNNCGGWLVPIGDRVEKHFFRIGAVYPDGTTPLEEALIRTGCEMSARQESRKVIFVITDGYISCMVKGIVKKMKEDGYIIAGIVVGNGVSLADQNFNEAFDIKASLSNFAELEKTLFEISKQVLA